jgi:transmembrane sensor
MSENPRDLSDWRLLDAWLAGSATPAERAAIESWMAVDPRNAEFVRGLEAAIRQPAVAVDVDRAWEATRRRMVPPRHSAILRFAPAIAAGIVIVAALGVWASRVPRTIDVATGAGEQRTLVLDDGSRITLNASSRLRHPGHFGTVRQVELIGEALFEVRHDEARPFEVHSRGAVVTDLGTRFVVRAYPDLADVRVGVSEGSVSLRHERARDSVVLQAGMAGRLDSTGVASIDRGGDGRAIAAWTDGSMVFSAAPLKEVAGDLERRFGVVIRVDDSLAARRLTATFRRETLDQVLGALDVSLGLRHDRLGDTIRIRPPASPR